MILKLSVICMVIGRSNESVELEASAAQAPKDPVDVLNKVVAHACEDATGPFVVFDAKRAAMRAGGEAWFYDYPYSAPDPNPANSREGGPPYKVFVIPVGGERAFIIGFGAGCTSQRLREDRVIDGEAEVTCYAKLDEFVERMPTCIRQQVLDGLVPRRFHELTPVRRMVDPFSHV